MLEKDVARRFQSPADLLVDLRNLRRDLDAEELSAFLSEMSSCLHALQQQLSARSFRSMTTVPADADLVPEFLTAELAEREDEDLLPFIVVPLKKAL